MRPNDKAEESDIIINPDDFKSIEVHLVMINETSSTQVMKGRRKYGEELVKQASADVKFLEFADKGMVVEVPHPSCEKGHVLTLEIHVTGIKNDLNFTVTSKVSELEHLAEARDRIHVTLVAHDEFFWNAFRSVFQKRQQDISDFFFAAKG